MLIRSTLLSASLLIAAGSAFADSGDHIEYDGASGYLGSGNTTVITGGIDTCLRVGTFNGDNIINECEGIEEEEVVEEVVEEPEVIVEEPPEEPVDQIATVTLGGSTQFDTDSADLTAEGIATVDDLIAKLATYQSVTALTVTGHTDSTGSDEYNQDLSERRAQTVADKLSEAYPDANITSLGLGETDPTAPNDTAEGRLLNRRVTIAIEATRVLQN